MLQLQKRILPISKTSYEMNSLAVLTKGLFYYNTFSAFLVSDFTNKLQRKNNHLHMKIAKLPQNRKCDHSDD
jgi:hypothetical protein